MKNAYYICGSLHFTLFPELFYASSVKVGFSDVTEGHQGPEKFAAYPFL